MVARVFALLGAALLLSACATHVTGRTLTGRWGGEQIELVFDEKGLGRIILPCASAEMAEQVRTQVGGHFLVSGRFIQGSGAPPPVPPVPVPANISGRLDNDGTLWISIATRDGMKVNNAKLRQDRPAALYLCP